jgi:hypothetical protein
MEELDGSFATGSAVANHFKLLLATKIHVTRNDVTSETHIQTTKQTNKHQEALNTRALVHSSSGLTKFL